jgi:hypothetical protein
MDSKIKTLSQITGYTEPELQQRETEPIIQPYDCLQAMNDHARNVAVEFLMWYDGELPELTAGKIVESFLQSDYLKERTEG